MWLGRCADFLTAWLTNLPKLYGGWALTLSAHLTSHLCRTVRLLGPLWAVNCFSFESYNSVIKRTIHSHKGGQHKEFARAYVTILTLRELSDRYVRADTPAAKLLTKFGFAPLSQTNAEHKSTWVPTSEEDTWLVDKLGEFLVEPTSDDSSDPDGWVEGGMLYRQGKFIYSRAHKSSGLVPRFSSCVMVQGQHEQHAVEYPAFVDRFLVDSETGRAFAQITPLAPSYLSLSMCRLPFARLAHADPKHYLPSILVPVSCILRNLFFVHIKDRKFTDGNEYGYILEYTHTRAVDPSMSLNRYVGKYSQLVSFEIM